MQRGTWKRKGGQRKDASLGAQTALGVLKIRQNVQDQRNGFIKHDITYLTVSFRGVHGFCNLRTEPG